MEPRIIDYDTFSVTLHMQPLKGTKETVFKYDELRRDLLLNFFTTEEYNNAYRGIPCSRTDDISYLCGLTNPRMIYHIKSAITQGIYTRWSDYTVEELNPTYTIFINTLQTMQDCINRYHVRHNTGDLMRLFSRDQFNNLIITDTGWSAYRRLEKLYRSDEVIHCSKYRVIIDLLQENGGGTHTIPYVLYLGYSQPDVYYIPLERGYVEGIAVEEIEKLAKRNNENLSIRRLTKFC